MLRQATKSAGGSGVRGADYESQAPALAAARMLMPGPGAVPGSAPRLRKATHAWLGLPRAWAKIFCVRMDAARMRLLEPSPGRQTACMAPPAGQPTWKFFHPAHPELGFSLLLF